MKNFKQLLIWQKGIEIVKETYLLARQLPGTEKFGLYVQMTRAAVSVPSNIAEGSSRKSNKDYNRFLEIALGSLFELETQFVVTIEVGFLKAEQLTTIFQLIDEEQKMIMSFMRKISHEQ